MRVCRVILLLLVFLSLFLYVQKPVLAQTTNDAPYCKDDHHLCSCGTFGSANVERCCLNTLVGENIGYNICIIGSDPLEVDPGTDIKAAQCPSGTNQPMKCAGSNPDFCCKTAALSLVGDCSGIKNNLSCDQNVIDAKAIHNYFSRNQCGSLDWRFTSSAKDSAGNTVPTYVCTKVAPSSWLVINTCSNGSIGVDTAIGCVPTANLKDFLAWILNYAFFASGGVILLMVISTGYTLITSQGNPEKLQAAKENIVSLLSGLILIAFSFILLQAIGADILNLPTFK